MRKWRHGKPQRFTDVEAEPLLQALDIEYERRGKELWARCPHPEHDDANPSWALEADPNKRGYLSHWCFAAETMVLTRDGYFPISELVGRRVRVLTGPRPSWVDAEFRSYGVQSLMSVTVSRNGVVKVIRATPEHRWFVRSSNPRTRGSRWERTTEQLKPGNRLETCGLPRAPTIKPSRLGVIHGYVFGDGTRTSDRGSRAAMYCEKDIALLPLFDGVGRIDIPTRRKPGDPILQINGLPGFFKDRPSLDESAAYLYGWLSGYFAADGCVDEAGMPTLASASRENLEFVRLVCLRLGIFVYGVREQQRVGFGANPSALYSLSFGRRSLCERFFAIPEHRERWCARREVRERPGWTVVSIESHGEREEVFCTEIPKTHSFALEGNILVGNCFSCEWGGGPVELVRAVLGVDYEEAAAFLKKAPTKEPSLEIEVDVRPVNLGGRGIRTIAGYREKPLAEMPSMFRDYLTSREITADDVRNHRIGYAVDGRLAGRVIFPMIDGRGNVLSYTARSATGDPKRYKEPRKDERASKSAIFGEHLWLDRGWRGGLFLVEGCPDKLTLEKAARSHGLGPWASFGALHGSQLTPGQAIKIASFPYVVAATDPDPAGDRIAQDLEDALGGPLKVFRLRPPDGEDWSGMGVRESARYFGEHCPRRIWSDEGSRPAAS